MDKNSFVNGGVVLKTDGEKKDEKIKLKKLDLKKSKLEKKKLEKESSIHINGNNIKNIRKVFNNKKIIKK